MFTHVLVPIDCSDDARRDADRIARYLAPLDGARVTLAASVSPSLDPIFRDKKWTHAQQALRAVSDLMFEHGIRAIRLILEGADDVQELGNEACSVDAQYDCFVGIPQTRPDLDEFPCRGSFADRLAQRTHLPVLILPYL